MVKKNNEKIQLVRRIRGQEVLGCDVKWGESGRLYGEGRIHIKPKRAFQAKITASAKALSWECEEQQGDQSGWSGVYSGGRDEELRSEHFGVHGE